MDAPAQPSMATEPCPHAPCPACGSRPPTVGRPILGALLLIAMVTWGHVVDGDRRGIDGFFELGFWPTGLTLVISLWVSTMLISGCGFRTPREQLAALLAGQRRDLTELRAALRLTIVVGPVSGLLGALLITRHAMADYVDLKLLGALLALALSYLLYGLIVGLLAYGLEVLAGRRGLEVSPQTEGPADAGAEGSADATAPHGPCPTCGVSPDPGWMVASRAALGLLLLVATVVGVHVLEDIRLYGLFAPINALVIGGASMGAVLIGCGLSAPLGQLGALLRGHARDVTALRRALGLVVVVAPLAGLLGMVSVCVRVLANLSDPTRLFAGLAVALHPMIWGLVAALGAHGLEVLACRRGLEGPPRREGAAEGAAGRPLLGGALLVCGIFSSHILEGGHLAQFIDASVGLLVIGLVVAALVMTCDVWASCQQLARLVLGRPLDDDRALRVTLGVAAWVAPVAGAVGLALGSMLAFFNLTDPTRLGSGVALALVALFYAGGLTIASHALSTLTRTRAGDVAVERPSPGYGVLMAITGVVGSLMLVFAVLYALTPS